MAKNVLYWGLLAGAWCFTVIAILLNQRKKPRLCGACQGVSITCGLVALYIAVFLL